MRLIEIGVLGFLVIGASACSKTDAEQRASSGVGGGSPSSSSSGVGGSGTFKAGASTGTGAGKACAANADCNDGDPCTTDVCVTTQSGELNSGHCQNTMNGSCKAASSSTGAPSSTSSGLPPPPPPNDTCPAGCAGATSIYPPPAPIVAPGLPSSCGGGFEINNPPQGAYTVMSTSPNGSAARDLDIEIATYLAPDHIRITGVDAANHEFTIVDTCSMQTATYSDPTNGCTRPPDDSIRQFKGKLPAGTKSLTFDVSGACTPIYLKVLGLCDFNVSPFFAGCGFRPAN